MGEEEHQSALGAIIGWGVLFIFALGFGYYVGAPLLMGERWADKKDEAINLVKESKPSGNNTLYDMIRAYSLAAKDQDVFIGEFKWDALQREGPEYEVTLLWTEEGEKRVAVWRVNLQDQSVRPQGNEASALPRRIEAGPPKKKAG